LRISPKTWAEEKWTPASTAEPSASDQACTFRPLKPNLVSSTWAAADWDARAPASSSGGAKRIAFFAIIASIGIFLTTEECRRSRLWAARN
jgi:hypothetical protein